MPLSASGSPDGIPSSREFTTTARPRYTGRFTLLHPGRLEDYRDVETHACFVTHLESALDGTTCRPIGPQTLHQDRPLWVRYDLERCART